MIQVDIAVSVLLRIIHECARTYIGMVRATTCTRGTVAAPLPLEAVAFTPKAENTTYICRNPLHTRKHHGGLDSTCTKNEMMLKSKDNGVDADGCYGWTSTVRHGYIATTSAYQRRGYFINEILTGIQY